MPEAFYKNFWKETHHKIINFCRKHENDTWNTLTEKLKEGIIIWLINEIII